MIEHSMDSWINGPGGILDLYSFEIRLIAFLFLCGLYK